LPNCGITGIKCRFSIGVDNQRFILRKLRDYCGILRRTETPPPLKGDLHRNPVASGFLRHHFRFASGYFRLLRETAALIADSKIMSPFEGSAPFDYLIFYNHVIPSGFFLVNPSAPKGDFHQILTLRHKGQTKKYCNQKKNL